MDHGDEESLIKYLQKQIGTAEQEISKRMSYVTELEAEAMYAGPKNNTEGIIQVLRTPPASTEEYIIPHCTAAEFRIIE